MKTIHDKVYKLNPEGVDTVSRELVSVLASYPTVSKKEMTRLRLSAEDILLKWLDVPAELTLRMMIDERGRSLDITLILGGVSYGCNPLDTAEFNGIGTVDNLMAALGEGWVYQLDSGNNTVYTSVIIKRTNRLKWTLIAVLAALITVFIVNLLPEAVGNALNGYLIDPLFTYGSSFLKGAVSPMMLLTVIGGVMSVGSPKYLDILGGKVCGRYLFSTLLTILSSAVIVALVFNFSTETDNNGNFLNHFDFIKEIVPDNMITPFTECNMLQIVFIGIVIGIALLLLQKQTKTIGAFIEDSNVLITKVLSGFEIILPEFIYLSIVSVGLTASAKDLLTFGKMALFFVLFLFAVSVVNLSVASIKTGVPVKYIWKKCKSTCLESVLSASSSASFTGSYDMCHTTFGIDAKLTGFALPIGTVMHKPLVAAEFIFFVAAAKEYYGESLNFGSLTVLVIMAFVLSIAYPPISGGEITCYTVLIAQMGLPISLLALACTVSSLLDYLETPANVMATELQLFNEAKNLGLIDSSANIINRIKKENAK